MNTQNGKLRKTKFISFCQSSVKNHTLPCSRTLLIRSWRLWSNFVRPFSKPKCKSSTIKSSLSLAPNANSAHNWKQDKSLKQPPNTQEEASLSLNVTLIQSSCMEITCIQSGHHRSWYMPNKKWVMIRLSSNWMKVSWNCFPFLKSYLSIDISMLCPSELSQKWSKKARMIVFLKRLLIISTRFCSCLLDFCLSTLWKSITGQITFRN